MNDTHKEVIIKQQIENIKKLLNATVTSTVACYSSGKCEYRLTFTYEDPSSNNLLK